MGIWFMASIKHGGKVNNKDLTASIKDLIFDFLLHNILSLREKTLDIWNMKLLFILKLKFDNLIEKVLKTTGR